MKQRRRLWYLVGAFLVVLCLGIGVFLYAVRWQPDPNDCCDVCGAFSAALRSSRAQRAQSLAVSEQWDRIDAWVAEHTAFDMDLCLSWLQADIDDSDSYVGCLYPSDTPDVRCNTRFFCPIEGGSRYYFAIHDVILRPTEQGCLVVDWGEIDESEN